MSWKLSVQQPRRCHYTIMTLSCSSNVLRVNQCSSLDALAKLYWLHWLEETIHIHILEFWVTILRTWTTLQYSLLYKMENHLVHATILYQSPVITVNDNRRSYSTVCRVEFWANSVVLGSGGEAFVQRWHGARHSHTTNQSQSLTE